MLIRDTDKIEYEIDITGKSGEVYMRCPKCSDKRTKKNLKPFSFNISKGVGFCNHCNTPFISVEPNNIYQKVYKEYKKPIQIKSTGINIKVIDWFKTRGISEQTLKEAKVSNSIEFMPQKSKEVNVICFNYYENNEIINIKYRDSEKNFKLYKDAKLIPYNIDSIKNSNEFYIVEGEMDCLTLIEIGIKNVISVPNGAVKNLTWMDDYIYLFENKTAIIAVDNDIKGIELKNELIRRLEPENCRIVNWIDCKDANECLLKFGKDKLLKTLYNYEFIKVSGIFDLLDFENELDQLYFNGLQQGKGIGYDIFDSLCTFETGKLAIITGIPGHGKSEFIDELTSRLNILHEWKCGYFSPENLPLKIHASKLIRKYSGKQFNAESLDSDNYIKTKIHLYNNFYFIVPEDSFDVDSILNKMLYLIKTRGIKIAVIDPWNRIEHQQDNNESETRYISRILDKLTTFAKKHDILIILAAHPVKMQKKDGKFEVPNLYSISGSANFFAKTDYGITVYRDDDIVEVHIQKVKFEHLGHTGIALFKRNINNGRYEQINEISDIPMWRNYSYFDSTK